MTYKFKIDEKQTRSFYLKYNAIIKFYARR